MARADAQRNLAALLDAAKATFGERGVDAPAKAITDRAGVGVGTLYRHFPKRSDLIVAVMQSELDACVALADELATDPDPWDAVATWIDRFRELVATKSGLAAALHSGDPAYDGLPNRVLDRLVPPLAGLLSRAGASVRADVEPRDLLRAVAHLCAGDVDGDTGFSRRMVGILLDGLRVTAGDGAARVTRTRG